MRLLRSAPMSHFCDQRRRTKVTGLSDLMTLSVDLGCLYCKQTQRAFNIFKNTLNWLKIVSVDQKFNWLECGNFSQDAGTHGTERVIAFSQLAVKGLKNKTKRNKAHKTNKKKPNTHTHTHTHTHAHTQQTNKQNQTHTHMHAHTQTHSHTHKQQPFCEEYRFPLDVVFELGL
jgi:hypothetical protein